VLSIGYHCGPFVKRKGNEEGKTRKIKGKEKGNGERGNGERRMGKGKGKGKEIKTKEH
jgi:hypothetical protein